MKKILLFLMTVCAFVITNAQVCEGDPTIRRWIGNVTTYNPLGLKQAPIQINASSSDWDAVIAGAFAYSGSPKNTFETDPYPGPLAPANIQRDGLRAGTGVNYDKDAVGQDHRDLRYFAFTYDKANVYFFFRRPKNNTAQVSLYYFIDTDVDGWMRTGEPVINITFNNSGSSIEMGYYVAGTGPNGTPASAYDATKGNIMTAPVARAKTNNSSEWAVGSADGWNMPGDFVAVSSLPLLGTVDGVQEVFDSKTLIDNFSDGPESGFGVEFAVPWSYLGFYLGGALQNGTALNYTKVFTWHVSLGGGNSGISGAEDNAGGCCSGLALSAPPSVGSTGLFGDDPVSASMFDYRLSITYQENAGVKTKITTSQIVVRNPKDGAGEDMPGANIAGWILTAFADANCNADNAEGTVGLNYVAGSSEPNDADGPGGNKDYVFNFSNPLTTMVTAQANLSACIYINFATGAAGWPPLKSANVKFVASTEFDIPSQSCFATQIGGAGTELGVLPVKFTYFNAARNGQNVNLTWQTTSEENNTGFEVQRLTSGGDWQNVGFVSTKAVNGNSGIALNYQFTDINTSKGITQYRLKQVDKDYRSAYTVIRSVRGIGQKANTIIYPNPSGDGKVNIVFEDAGSVRDVSLMDVSGKTLKQWKGVTNNNIRIDNLNSGFYTVRIVNIETGEQVVEKFIVNKR
jgi:hypothetical protein